MTSRIVSLLAAVGLCLASGSANAWIDCSYDGSSLQVGTTEGESVVLSVSGGLVKVNGADPELGGVPFTVPVAGLGVVGVTGDDLPQTLDLSGLSTANGFASGSGCSLRGGGGDDVLIGAGLSTDFDGGPGADSCQGGTTNDSYRIHPGEGPDMMTTLGGNSVFYLEGDDSDETYHLFRDGEALVINSGLPESEYVRLTGGVWIMFLTLNGGDDSVTTGDLTGFGIANMTLHPGSGKFNLESSASGIFNQLEMDARADESVISGGVCELTYEADDAGETATLTASGTEAVLSRVAPRPATIRLTGVNWVRLFGGEGDDYVRLGSLEGTASGSVLFHGGEGRNVLEGEEYTGLLFVLTGLTPGSTEAHRLPNNQTRCDHWARDPSGSSLLLDAEGTTGRIVDAGTGLVPLTITGGADYILNMGDGDDSVEVRNLASASVRSILIGMQAGDDSLILRDLGHQPGFGVTAMGETHVGGDSLTLDASGMPYSLDEAGGSFTVGTAGVTFSDFESVTVINTPTPTPSPSPSPTPSPSPSATVSLTPSPTPSPTASLTPSATASPSLSPTPSATASPSPSPTLSPMPSPSATAVPGPGWVVR